VILSVLLATFPDLTISEYSPATVVAKVLPATGAPFARIWNGTEPAGSSMPYGSKNVTETVADECPSATISRVLDASAIEPAAWWVVALATFE
jgi:hypothetical protein